MKKKKIDLPTVMLTAMLIFGVAALTLPLAAEVASYRVDAGEYAAIARQYHPPSPSPMPVLSIPTPSKEAEIPAMVVQTQGILSEDRHTSDEPTALPKPSCTPNALSCAVPSSETWTEPVVTIGASSVNVEKFPASPAPCAPSSSSPVSGMLIPVATEKVESAVATLHCQEASLTPSPLSDTPTDSPHAICMPTSSPPTVPSSVPEIEATPTPCAGIDLEACLSQNKDFAAWLSIPGTVIDYPVVLSDNVAYYLHHTFMGKESKLGCLFSLSTSDYQLPSRNLAIYGHHLSHSDAMFSTLIKYKDEDYYAEHATICLDGIFGRRSYRIFAVLNMKVSDWDPATASFPSNREFLQFVNRAQSKSMYDMGVSVDEDDHIVTLITCDRSYGGVSGRLIVMAVQE